MGFLALVELQRTLVPLVTCVLSTQSLKFFNQWGKHLLLTQIKLRGIPKEVPRADSIPELLCQLVIVRFP